jgi:hypothetical protein
VNGSRGRPLPSVPAAGTPVRSLLREHSCGEFATAFVLAAIAAGDGTANRGAMSQDLEARVRAVVDEVRGSMQRDRAVALSSLAKTLAPRVSESAALPPRVRGILATLVAKEVGARWMRDAPPPRAGFRTSAALRHTLAALPEGSWRA